MSHHGVWTWTTSLWW
ncbi:UNVERIFIED_CONTAM: hypothetical protein GTU68_067048 [Idotea baltica]|nr:hypothetical protein [Idotea baltica]